MTVVYFLLIPFVSKGHVMLHHFHSPSVYTVWYDRVNLQLRGTGGGEWREIER